MMMVMVMIMMKAESERKGEEETGERNDKARKARYTREQTKEGR